MPGLSDFSIRARSFAAFGLMIALFAAVGFGSYVQMRG